MSKSHFFNEINFIRAVACLLVVMVHVTAVLYSAEDGFPDYITLVLNQLSRLGTPSFAVISAFLLFNSVKNRGFQLKNFIQSRTIKVVIPFIVWTLVYSSVSIWYLHWDDTPTSLPIFILTKFILGEGFYHLYFMALIIQFYCIFPLIQMICKKQSVLILFLASLPINYIFLKLSEGGFQLGIIDNIITNHSFVLNWIAYFLFGAVLAYYYTEIINFIKRNTILMITLFCLVLVGISFEINPSKIFTSSRYMNLIYIPIFILFLLGIYGFLDKNRVTSNIINIIGQYSMGIYLVHPLFIATLNKLLPITLWSYPFSVISYVLTISLSMLLIRAISYLPISKYIIPVSLSGNKKIKKDLPIQIENIN